MRPFARLLRTYAQVPEEVAASIDALDPDERVPISKVHQLLAGAVALTADEDVGLRAANLIGIGDYGALEYAASTATTAREALETIGRYMHLINDALTVTVREEGDRALFVMDNAVVMPRAAEAFELGAFYAAFRHRNFEQLQRMRYEVSFMHAQPEDTRAYVETFSKQATIHFGQPWCGFAFPTASLDEPIPSADPHLHQLVRKLADQLLSELPAAASLTARVRELIAAELASGKATSTHVASALNVSARTLTRRLTDEGTTFKQLSEEVRRNLALRYVGQTDLAFSEVAFLLGFSQASAFHRAFRRWTDRTPLEYRSERRG
jgi:AraC-like DNA-binding protein